MKKIITITFAFASIAFMQNANAQKLETKPSQKVTATQKPVVIKGNKAAIPIGKNIVLNAKIIGAAGTKYFNAKHTAKAWLTNEPQGLTLHFSTDANVTKATLESYDHPPYHNGDGVNTQTTNFPNPVKEYTFYLDAPTYKGHKAYTLQIVTPDISADDGMYWGCLVERK